MSSDRQAINLDGKFALFSDHWTPRIIGRLNDFHIKAVKLQGAFVWHKHDETDELFIVHKGALTIKYRDRDVRLAAGDIHILPKGVEHMPVAEAECEVLLIEPAGTLNTGDAGGARTVTEEKWI